MELPPSPLLAIYKRDPFLVYDVILVSYSFIFWCLLLVYYNKFYYNKERKEPQKKGEKNSKYLKKINMIIFVFCIVLFYVCETMLAKRIMCLE